MDYKYIEHLIERYWDCESTILEERILAAFFSQDDVPEHLLKYKDVFTVLNDVSQAKLGEDFDEKVLQKIEAGTTTAHRMSLYQSIRPLYRAAAMVAIVLTIGMAAEHSFVDPTLQDNTSDFASVQTDSIPEDPDAEYTQMPADMQNSSAKAANQPTKDSL